MAVPDYQSLMLPVLKALEDGNEVPLRDTRAHVVEAEGLTPEDTREMLRSGQQTAFANRVGWAMTYMVHAGLAERVRRGVHRLTPEGRRVLSARPEQIDLQTLNQYPSFVEWYRRKGGLRTRHGESGSHEAPSETPEEALGRAADQLREQVQGELLGRVREASPAFLERIVVDLLTEMGYGGGDPEMGRVTGSSGDGGIDGTIREDALGLDEVYVQAKRYAEGTNVGEGDLRNFAGAIDAAGTTKGVFVTTSSFTPAARDYVTRSPKRIVLIDGQELARLMEVHNVGLRTRGTYAVKGIDEDYFEVDG